ncbi:MAG: RNase J family beta-CASP ribonuclease [archaeon]
MRILALGGYGEFGRNMTAVQVGDEIVILDMGVHLENYIRCTEDEDIVRMSADTLIEEEAVPDISLLDKLDGKVIAIIPSHAHLDHIGGIPFLAKRFDAKVIGTPFSIAVLNRILKDERIKLPNKLVTLEEGHRIRLSKNFLVEFINTTHSTPQTVMIALRTFDGNLLYSNDFKFDCYPTLGKKTDMRRLRALGKEGLDALIVDSTYSTERYKMPSESVAKQMLKDVLLGTESKGKAVVVTTFSSHIARLASIIEFGKKMGRKIVFLGRSLNKYSMAAEEVGLVNFSEDIERVRWSSKVGKRLRQIEREGVDKYLLVVTGHQGEPKSVLTKMVNNKYGFSLRHDDHVVFSCKTIPSPTNIENRAHLERQLAAMGVRMFTDIHVSGHAGREDLRDLIEIVRPKHVIPAHGTEKMTTGLASLAEEMGYKQDVTVHLMENGKLIEL